MNIRQVLAGSLAAITAGATIIFGAAALTDFSSYVVTSDGSLKSPVIVVGAPASPGSDFAKDVIGAADIAANVAGFATKDVSIGGGTTVSVSGGVVTTTQSTLVYLGDDLGESGLKTTLTKSDLTTLLASGTFTDNNGNTYPYNQYINLNNGTVAFGTSGGDFNDPILYLDIGSMATRPVYNLTVVLNKVLVINSTDVQGNALDIFGGRYTISSGSVFSGGSGTTYAGGTKKLVLFGSSDTLTMSEGEEKEITVAGTKHTVKLLGVSSATTAVVSIDGVSKTVTKQAATYKISGVDVYADDVYYFSKEGQVSQAKLSFGSQKLTLEQGQAVKVGTEETTIDGTLVTLTGSVGDSTLSKISIGVTGKDSSKDWIKQSQTDATAVWTDPVFGKLKINFWGISGGTTETITVDNSGTTGANLKFKDYFGNEKTITWAYTPATWNPELNESSTKAYRVREGEGVKKGEYFLYTPSQGSEFSHIFKYNTVSSLGNSGAYIELYDVMSGETSKIYLTQTGYYAGTAYIDGNPVYIEVGSTSQTATFYWGSGATYNNTGDKITVWPLIKTSKGGWVTLVTNVTLANLSTYELPTNGSFVYNDGAHNNRVIPVTTMGGRIKYAITGGRMTVEADYSTSSYNVTAPAVLFVEEEGKDDSSPAASVKDAVIVSIYDGSGTGADINIGYSASLGPGLTAVVKASGTMNSDNSVTLLGDRYGTFVKWDTDNQGLAEITYPDEQSVAYVGFGENPTFSSSSTAAQTVKEAIKITSPVAKLDSEVSLTAPGADLVIVGGPCANKLAAIVLNMSSDSGTCYTDWTTAGYNANGVSGGPNGVIKEVTDAFTDGSKALVVAGNSADDTRALAAKVIAGTYAYPA